VHIAIDQLLQDVFVMFKLSDVGPSTVSQFCCLPAMSGQMWNIHEVCFDGSVCGRKPVTLFWVYSPSSDVGAVHFQVRLASIASAAHRPDRTDQAKSGYSIDE